MTTNESKLLENLVYMIGEIRETQIRQMSVTLVRHVTPGPDSGREYEARKTIQVPIVRTERGTIYEVDDELFVVDAAVITSTGLELHGPLCRLSDNANLMPEVPWREKMSENGWDVRQRTYHPRDEAINRLENEYLWQSEFGCNKF